jgi:hypothetical protein
MGIDEIIAKLRREAAGPLRSEEEIAEEQREAEQLECKLDDSTLRFMRGPRHEFYEPATENDIAATEQAIGLPLPPSFRRFATKLSNGANLYQGQEVARVGRGNERIDAIPENEWHYGDGPADSEPIPIREGGTVEFAQLIPFSLDSNGNEWCFIAEPGSPEYRCAYFAGPLESEEDRRLYAPLESFVAWLNVLMDADGEDEVIRLVYRDDDAVLLDELGLG